MKYTIAILLLIITSNLYSQLDVTGVIRNSEGDSIIGATIIELGSNNKSITDLTGHFNLKTNKDTCTISISFIGCESVFLRISKDTVLNIVLKDIVLYEFKGRKIYHNLTIGMNNDFLNSQYGLSISNGWDEKPILHFEDFQDRWIFKLGGSSNFKNDYSFEIKAGITNLFRYYTPTVEYKERNYSVDSFTSRDINLKLVIYPFRIPLKIKIGHQTLNNIRNFGAGIGFEKSHYLTKIYYGAMVSYWLTNYLTYEVYFQSFIYKRQLSIKASYENIHENDFANIGLNYTLNYYTNKSK